MGRIYTQSVAATAISAAIDLFEVLAGARPVEVHGWHLFQTSDLGDAEEEVIGMEMVRGIGATSGSGGNGAVEFPRDVDDSAALCAIETMNTTRLTAGGGSLETIGRLGWNLRGQWDFFFPPELRPLVDAGAHWALGMLAPNDSVSVGGMIWVGEV